VEEPRCSGWKVGNEVRYKYKSRRKYKRCKNMNWISANLIEGRQPNKLNQKTA
jgi:hypothetical protein